jgi:hypothetical protein
LALEAILQAVEPRARLTPEGPHAFAVHADPTLEPAETPQAVTLTRLSSAASWRFRDFG